MKIERCTYYGWDEQSRKYRRHIFPEETTEKEFTDWVEQNNIIPSTVICTNLIWHDWPENPYDENGVFFSTGIISHEYCLSGKNRKSKIVFWQWNSHDGFSYCSEKGKPLKIVPGKVKDEIKTILENMLRHFHQWEIICLFQKGMV
jgi:hypothetical protein